MALAALAIENYKNENGHLPEKLEDLASNIGEDELMDPFAEVPLKYRPFKTGYVVYSIGPDLNDNYGLEEADKKESSDTKSYDITFTLER